MPPRRTPTEYGRDVITGRDRSVAAHALRGLAAVAEPAYATAMRVRNLAYDRGWAAAHDLGRPTVSVGNLTTGGTGKTPVVRWLVEQLRAAGRRPAVLLRGYKSAAGEDGDEARLLRQSLGPTVPVVADPSRVDGAAALLRERTEVDLFVLDDAFQHRRARRDVDLVLVSATDPFGGGHVLPRGLLREPTDGLRRATAVVLTRCGLVDGDALSRIEATVARHTPDAAVFRCDAELTGTADLEARSFFAVAGIGDPDALDVQLRRLRGGRYVGHRWFADHHAYTPTDVAAVRAAATAAGAAVVVTTGKDWVKLAGLVSGVEGSADGGLPFVTVGQRLSFRHGDADRLLDMIQARTAAATCSA